MKIRKVKCNSGIPCLCLFLFARSIRCLSQKTRKPKVRAITAFVVLDRRDYQSRVRNALKILPDAKVALDNYGYAVETIRIATQPFLDYTRGLTREQALWSFRNFDDLALPGGS